MSKSFINEIRANLEAAIAANALEQMEAYMVSNFKKVETLRKSAKVLQEELASLEATA